MNRLPIEGLDTWELVVLSFGGAVAAGVSIPLLMAGLADLLLMVLGVACFVWLVADFIDGYIQERKTEKIMKER